MLKNWLELFEEGCIQEVKLPICFTLKNQLLKRLVAVCDKNIAYNNRKVPEGS